MKRAAPHDYTLPRPPMPQADSQSVTSRRAAEVNLITFTCWNSSGSSLDAKSYLDVYLSETAYRCRISNDNRSVLHTCRGKDDERG